MWSVVYLITGAIFIALLITIFFSKEKIDSEEIRCFKVLTIANLLEYVFEGLLHLLFRTGNMEGIASSIVSKSFLILILFWGMFFTLYVTVLCFKNKQYNKVKKLLRVLIGISFVIGFILIIALPETKFHELDVVYIYGASVDVLKVFSFAYIFLWIILLIGNRDKLLHKEYIPIYINVVLLIVGGIVQTIDPSILISSVTTTIVCYTIFFTIENPDMRLLQEAHKAKEISDSANEEKTLFIYNLTQEVRNITGKINDDADTILDSKEYDEIHDAARDIKAKTSEFTSITNDILDVGTIDSANLKTYNNKYSVKNIIKQMINVYGDICKNKELKFRTNIDHDIPDTLYGDGINLKEVLNTILSNSTKYTSKGFVELSVNTIIKNDICRLIFTIEDSGTGIKSEDINKIKVDDKSLSKANKLITMMNGTMIISSNYGVGTKVKVILDQKIGEEEATEVSKYDNVFDNIDILSVDDSESGLKIIEKLLKGTNIKLDLASTGKECLDKIKIGKYDLILLDEDLSQISGTELMQKIKEIRNFKTPVILLTKDNSYEYNEEYIKIGFVDYILKPLNKEALLEKINKYTKKDKE